LFAAQYCLQDGQEEKEEEEEERGGGITPLPSK